MKTIFKLVYFDAPGRAEVIRLIFAATQQDFVDIRLNYQDWIAFKPHAPFEQLPVLVVEHKGRESIIAQTKTIARYLAKRFNLLGRNEDEELAVDMYTEQIGDLVNDLLKFEFEIDAEKASMEKYLFGDLVPRNLRYFEQRIKKNGTGYLVGKRLTWADIYLFSGLNLLGPRKRYYLKEFPNLKRFYTLIRRNKGIEEWIRISKTK